MAGEQPVAVGRVVYVFANPTWRIGRVTAWRDGRGEVQHPGGDGQTYPGKRLARISEKTVTSLPALVAYRDHVRCLCDEIDLAGLWEAVSGEEDGRCWDVSELSSLALPTAVGAADDAMAWVLFDDAVYFKCRKDGRFVPNGSRVVGERLRQRVAQRHAEEDFRTMVDWLRDLDTDRPPQAARAIEALQKLVLFEDSSPGVRLGRRLVAEAFEGDERGDCSIAWETLLALGVWRPDENLSVHRSGLPTSWGRGVLEEGDHLASLPAATAERVDRRDVPCVAIDDRWTTEVDDALGIVESDDGTRTVFVFITDVAARVDLGSAVDAEARRRGSTLYLPEGKVPMMPESLCDGASSLQPGVDRPALGLVIKLDSEGAVAEFDVEEALVRVEARVTYEEADAILAGAPSPVARALHGLAEAAESLRTERLRVSSLTLDRREVAIHVEDGDVQIVTYRTDDLARRTVAEWMIQACSGCAAWCRERSIPTLYRRQDAPAGDRPPTDRRLRPFELSAILRTVRRAEMTTHPDPHAGLGVECYTQVTSPLRRYADLSQHRQIKAWLHDEPPPFRTPDLHALFEELGELQLAHGRVERESRRFWLLRALEARIGERVQVEVLRPVGRRVSVEILETGLVTLWRPDTPVSPGDALELRIAEASARDDRLTLASQGLARRPR